MTILEKIKNFKIVPVVTPKRLEETLSAIGALARGGLPVAEITFRTAYAAESIRMAVKKYPHALIGAGTVINADQCRSAIESGAAFIVSPGLSAEVAEICKDKNVLYLPGAVTPTEIIAALALGITALKFFPASRFGGVKTVKAICAAFPQIEIMPTGGVNEENVLEYLEYDKVIACGGSWMAKGTPEEIELNTKKTVALIKGDR